MFIGIDMLEFSPKAIAVLFLNQEVIWVLETPADQNRGFAQVSEVETYVLRSFNLDMDCRGTTKSDFCACPSFKTALRRGSWLVCALAARTQH